MYFVEPITLTSEQRASAGRYFVKRKAQVESSPVLSADTQVTFNLKTLEEALEKVDAHAKGKQRFFTDLDFTLLMFAADRA
jgi:hypothetical protein